MLAAIPPLECNSQRNPANVWAPMSPVGDVALSPRSGRCFYTLMEVMGPLNWPTCHSSSKDYIVVNMHRANYMGIPRGPEPSYAHLFLWSYQQTPAIYQSPAHPHWCLLRKKEKSNVSRPGSSPPHESIHMHRGTEICLDIHPRWCLHRSHCLPHMLTSPELLAHALSFISLYHLRMHPGLQSNGVPSCSSCPSDPSEGKRLDKHMLMAVYDPAE